MLKSKWREYPYLVVTEELSYPNHAIPNEGSYYVLCPVYFAIYRDSN